MQSFPEIFIQWPQSSRLIPSRFPPVELYEFVCSPKNQDSVKRVEGLTNPRQRRSMGGASPLHPDDQGRSYQHWIEAPFMYPDPEPSPFSDGTYGVCVLTETPEAALIRAVQRREAFLGWTKDPPTRLEMRMLKTPLKGKLHDLSGLENLDDWETTQTVARSLREKGSYGFVLPDTDGLGRVAVALRPTILQRAVQAEHYAFLWDGTRINKIYDFSNGHETDPSEILDDAKSRAA